MVLNIILTALLLLAFAIIIWAVYIVRLEFLQARRIQNGSVFVNGAWTPAPTTRIKRTEDEQQQLAAAGKAARPAAARLHRESQQQVGIKLTTADIRQLIVKGGFLRLDAHTGVRYDTQSQNLVKVSVPSAR